MTKNQIEKGAYPITGDTTHRVLLYYKYTPIANPELLMERERAVCEVLGLKGRIIVAEEGINGTVEGTMEATEKYMKHLRSDKKFRMIDFKESAGTGDAFPRLSVKVRPELVGQKLPKRINPNKVTGKHLQPDELNRWYRDNKDDFVIVDMRSKYETMVGLFDKSIDIDVDASRDMPTSQSIEDIKRAAESGKKIVTVCTGGVKCERMSAYLIDQGLDKKNVYQLHNGIHAYMQKFPGEDFNGTLYTFDGRKTMHFGGNRKIYARCYKCNVPSEEIYDVDESDGHEYQRIVCDNCVVALGENARRGNVYRVFH